MKNETSPETRGENEGNEEKEAAAAAECAGEQPALPSGKRLFGVRVTSLLLVAYIASFCGWCVENVFRMLAIGVLDSRHQILPFLAAYGFGIFVLFFVFGTPTEMRIFKKRILPENTKGNHALRVVVYYALVFVLILFGEMSVGLLFDKCFGVQAWDYRNIPLHITRYTSIPTTFGFTTGITLLMHFVFRPVVAFFERLPRKLCFWLALIFGVLIAADYCIMIGGMLVTGHFPNYWSIRFGK